MRFSRRVAAVAVGASAALATAPAAPLAAAGGSPTYRLLKQDVIIHADVWAKRPKMMAAGLGFTDIIGVPGLTTDDLARSEQLARAAGGTWNTIACASGESPTLAAYTSASTPQQVANAYGHPTTLSDGLPVEFSWPIRPSTLDPTDFRITFNTGRTVVPELASIYPNEEYNERSVAVLFGEFGNRLPSSAPGAEYPVLTRVVRDRTPLQLVGPDSRIVSAVGLHVSTSTSPYDDPNAPRRAHGPEAGRGEAHPPLDSGRERTQALPLRPAQRRTHPLRPAGPLSPAGLHQRRLLTRRGAPSASHRVLSLLPPARPRAWP
jgi:hypothetical protein